MIGAAGVLMALNALDYGNLGEKFDDGKARFALLSLVPVSFMFFYRRLGAAPAFVGALSLFSYTFYNYRPSHNAVLPVILIMACLALAAFVVELGQRFLAWALIGSGCFQSVLALMQFFHFKTGLFLAEKLEHPVGYIGNHTLLAAFLCICFAPALWLRVWPAVALMGAAILACHSVGGLVCLCVVLAARWRSAAILALPAMAAWALYGRSILDSDGRLFMWSFGLEAVKESPLWGSGLGAWEHVYLPKYAAGLLEKFSWHLPRALHNDYLDFAVEHGLFALAAVCAFIARFAVRFRPTWQWAVCASLLVNAFFSFPASQVYLAIPFAACWGFCAWGDECRAMI